MNAQDRESVIKLKLLGTLKIGDKINTRYLSIQPDSFATKISRYMYSENRNNTVIFCRNTIDQVQQMLKTIQDEKIKKIIIDDLEKARLGMVALQETYCDDIRVVSELAEIIETA